MIDLALSRVQEDAFAEALTSSHRVRLEVAIHDRDEKRIGGFSVGSRRVLDGSVQVDASADNAVDRSLSLTFLDPDHKLAFTPDSPGQGGLFADNFVSVRYCVEVQELDDWVEVPVFWGPLTLFEHSGGTVSIEAQGKESLGLEPFLAVHGYTIRKGTRVDDALRRVLGRMGENRITIPRITRKLGADVVVTPTDQPWLIIVGGGEGGKRRGLLEETGDRPHHAYYDGEGRFTVRRLVKSRCWTFGARHLISKPTLSWSKDESRNFVRVRGGKPKGAKRAVTGEARLPDGNPLSPEAMARHGEPRFLAEIVDAENLKTTKECNTRADELLEHREKVSLECSFESLPVPHLEPLDRVAVDTEEGRIEFAARSFTIPLTASETMSVGFTKRVRQRRPRHRHHGRR